MQYMFLMMSEEAGWGEMPPAEQEEWLERYRGFDADMRRAGVVVSANHLAPSVSARTVQVREGRKVVTDGPFAETKEHCSAISSSTCPAWTRRWNGRENAPAPITARSRSGRSAYRLSDPNGAQANSRLSFDRALSMLRS